MPLTNPNKVVTEERLSEFYGQILPYMGGMPDVLANKFSKGDLYSTDEKMIGCWVDGKPLYQKTVYNTSLSSIPNNNWVTYCTIENLKDLVSFKFMRTSNDGGSLGVFNDICGSNSGSNVTCISRTSALTLDYSKSYATIMYTKTTDSPIAIGSDTDYSTDEKIVGTWIDGKPIWQKTIQTTMASTSGEVKFVSTGTTIAKVIDYKAMIYTGGAWGQKLESIGANNELNSFGRCIVTSSADTSNPNKIGLSTNISGWLNQEVIVTIQYTKTS